MRRRTNLLVRHFTFKIATAIMLALLWTFLIAYLVHGHFLYNTRHLIFDLAYSYVMFYFLYEGHVQIISFLDKRYVDLQMSAEKYLSGLITFEVYSLLVFMLVNLVPGFIFTNGFISPLANTAELRLNVIMLLLVSAIYYGILTSFHVFKNIHQASLQAEKLQKEIAQAQFETLKNQVNPHFLFNSLNALTSLISIDPRLAEKFTEQLSKAYRYVLEHKGADIVPLRTELDFIHSYIFLIDIRFKDKIKVDINLPPDKLNWLLPPLTLQLLIENAIKHNMVSKRSPLLIEIFVDENDYLCVRNNLQERDDKMASSQVGLRNITNRYGYITDLPTFFGIVENNYLAKIPLLQ